MICTLLNDRLNKQELRVMNIGLCLIIIGYYKVNGTAVISYSKRRSRNQRALKVFFRIVYGKGVRAEWHLLKPVFPTPDQVEGRLRAGTMCRPFKIGNGIQLNKTHYIH